MSFTLGNDKVKLQDTTDGQGPAISMISATELATAYNKGQFSVMACLFTVNMETLIRI